MNSNNRRQTHDASGSARSNKRPNEVDDVALGLLLDLAYEPPAGLVREAIQAFLSRASIPSGPSVAPSEPSAAA